MPAPEDFPHSSPDQLQRMAGAGEPEPSPDVKKTKSEVNYRDAGSSNTRCEKCKHFRWADGGNGSCAVVAGRIDPGFVSDAFETRGSSLMDLITGEPTT